jgi:hypothetical protein
MPNQAVDLGEVDPGFGPVVVEQAQLNPVSDLAEEGEVGAGAVVSGTERVGGAWPDLHVSP